MILRVRRKFFEITTKPNRNYSHAAVSIMKLAKGGRVDMEVNEQLGPYCPTHKGVRQGDPSSPLLFNIIVLGNVVISKFPTHTQDHGDA